MARGVVHLEIAMVACLPLALLHDPVKPSIDSYSFTRGGSRPWDVGLFLISAANVLEFCLQKQIGYSASFLDLASFSALSLAPLIGAWILRAELSCVRRAWFDGPFPSAISWLSVFEGLICLEDDSQGMIGGDARF